MTISPTYTLLPLDCRQAMRLCMAPDSVDSIVTDPPYDLVSIQKRFGSAGAAPAQYGTDGAYQRASGGFMGAVWDSTGVAFDPDTWREAYRVLKPGGYLLAMGSTRTFHRLVTAIEDAGFEVRDTLSWNYASGFPKSHNVSKRLADIGMICLCNKTILERPDVSDQNMLDMSDALDAFDALPSGPQPDVQSDLRGDSYWPESESSRAEGRSGDSLRDVREIGAPGTQPADSHAPDLLQPVVSFEDFRRATTALRRQHEGQDETGPLRGGQPGVERRRNAETPEGELRRDPICASSGLGEADGSEGRLHNGASSRDGADVRFPSDPSRSRSSSRPPPASQSSVQSGTVADECGSPPWGGWPLCSGCGKPMVPAGLGTALKPAMELICMARKPLSVAGRPCSVAANVLAHGTGAINIDECRVEAPGVDLGRNNNARTEGTSYVVQKVAMRIDNSGGLGRFPANVMHDGSDEVLAGFPDAKGAVSNGRKGVAGIFDDGIGGAPQTQGYGDSGSAARYFYCAKASKADREEGLDGWPQLEAGLRNGSGRHLTRAYEDAAPKRANTHPTVKPTDLMRYLCRLVTPPGGLILDPFTGSGSTGKAALLEGFSFIGCEMTEEYVPIAEARLAHALAQRLKETTP